jgi:cell division septum initiation protein DivIVA
MFKTIIIKLFLSKEVAALKTRLAQATKALDTIEKSVVSIAKEAPLEAHALASVVLREVLDSADSVREKADGFAHEWELTAYADYKAAETDLVHKSSSALAYAKELLANTKVFFEIKLK